MKRMIGQPRSMQCATLVAGLVLATAAQSGAQSAAPQTMTVSAAVPMVPDSGMLAPDFTLPAMLGATKSNVDLRALRGRVIVIAFYPGDKTTGCTAELGKFRDEFSQLFGEGVSVLPISADNMTSHAAWSDEMHFPFALLSDTSQTVASLYGSTIPGRAYDNRTVFVVGRDGRILYRNLKFGALSEMAYRDLAAAVARAKAS